MKTIHKHLIDIRDGVQERDSHRGAKPVRVSLQGMNIAVHAEVRTENPGEMIRYAVHGTGQPIPSNHRYIGSVDQGPYVWHVYEIDDEVLF